MRSSGKAYGRRPERGRTGLWIPFVLISAVLLGWTALALATGHGTGGENPTTITSLTLAGDLPKVDGVFVTKTVDIVIVASFQGQPPPTHIQICESADFSNCSWQPLPFSGRISYRLTEGAGLKTIYLRARHLGRVGQPATIMVKYQP